jgi:hypothetical protein
MAAEIRARTGLPPDDGIVDLALGELVDVQLVARRIPSTASLAPDGYTGCEPAAPRPRKAVAINPAHAGRGPKHSVKRGKIAGTATRSFDLHRRDIAVCCRRTCSSKLRGLGQ